MTPRRTKIHNGTQLRHALEFSGHQWDLARAAHVIPPPDKSSCRWSGPVVDDLLARREELLTELDRVFPPERLARELGLEYGDVLRARDAGVFRPDRGTCWSETAARELAARIEQLRPRIPSQPLGAWNCASLLSELTGLEVTPDDVVTLAKYGVAHVIGEYKRWDLYDVDELKTIPDHEDRRAVLEEIVEERVAWMLDSLTTKGAARMLGWTEDEVRRATKERGVTTGRYDRYRYSDINALKGDETLNDDIRRERLLGRLQAADYIGIRAIDLKYAIDAAWLQPATIVMRRVYDHGPRVRVPLYRVGDVEDLLELPGVDWEEVRTTPPGRPSPLRRYARPRTRRTPDRPATIPADDDITHDHQVLGLGDQPLTHTEDPCGKG